MLGFIFICFFVTMAKSLMEYPLCHYSCSSSKLTCGVVILILSVLTLCDGSIEVIDDVKRKCDRGAISPREPMYVLGQNLTLVCNSRRSNAKYLYFIRGSNSEPVPDRFIQRINDTAIKLEYPVTVQDIKNHSSSMSYGCMKRRINKGSDLCIDNVYVQLDYKPEPPKDIECRIHDFSSINCTWSLGIDYVHSIHVDCKYQQFYYDYSNLQYKSDNEAANWQTCPLQIENSCIWQDENYTAPLVLFVNLTIRNPRNNISSTPVVTKFVQYDIIVPGPVENLHIIQNDKKGCVSLDWTPSGAGIARDFTYNLTYQSECSNPKFIEVNYNGLDKRLEPVTICSLNPHTAYMFSVRGRILAPKTFDGNTTVIAKGYWSPSVNITHITQSDVINVNPETTPGLYEIDTAKSLENTGYSTLRIYWKPLNACEQHSPVTDVTYMIKAYNISKNTSADIFFEQIDIPVIHNKINITVKASNSYGGPNQSNTVTVYPSKLSPEPSELIVQYNDTHSDCKMFATIETKDSRRLSHSIVWCKGTLKCMEPIHFENLGQNVSFYQLPDNVCGDSNYRFGLITHGLESNQGLVTNTGIRWTKCVYQIGKVPNEPLKNVQAIHGPKPGVEWTPYDCHKIRTLVKSYNISFCQVEDNDGCSCSGKIKIKQVSKNAAKFIVDGPVGVEKMCFWVTPITPSGPAPRTSPVMWRIENQNDNSSGPLIVLVAIGVIAAVLIVIVCVYYVRKKFLSLKEVELPPLDYQLLGMNPDYDDSMSRGQLEISSANTTSPLIDDHNTDISCSTGLIGYHKVNDIDSHDGYECSGYLADDNNVEEEDGSVNDIKHDLTDNERGNVQTSTDSLESSPVVPIKSLDGYNSWQNINDKLNDFHMTDPPVINIEEISCSKIDAKCDKTVDIDSAKSPKKIVVNGFNMKDIPEETSCSMIDGMDSAISSGDYSATLFADSNELVGHYDNVKEVDVGMACEYADNSDDHLENYRTVDDMSSSLDGIDVDDDDDTESDSGDKEELAIQNKSESVDNGALSSYTNSSLEEYLKAGNNRQITELYEKNGINHTKNGMQLYNGKHECKNQNFVKTVD